MQCACGMKERITAVASTRVEARYIRRQQYSNEAKQRFHISERQNKTVKKTKKTTA